jgi:signal transduction histidine kinase
MVEKSPVEKDQAVEDRVLIVDDEPKTLLVSSDILALDGWRVSTAKDGREALEAFVRERHDVLVTDLRMPQMGGMELLEMVRSIDEDVPIVILTGYATLDTATRAVARGAFDYLTKPVDFDRLRATLKRALERHRLVKENRRLVRELRAANARLGNANLALKGEVADRTRELELERDLLAQIHAAVPTALGVFDAGLALVRANDAWSRLGPLEDPLRAAIAKEVEVTARGAGAVRELHLTIEGPRGPRHFEVAVLPLAGARALVAAHDTTDRVRLEDELVQAEKLSSLGTLAGGVVHDLSNPLSAILGTAQILEEELGPRRPAELEAIVAAANYMREVCSGLTEFARRAQPGEEQPVDVNELAEKALALARYAKKLMDVHVERRLETGVPTVRANPTELLQVLVNLVVNAADAAPRGRIVVATARSAAGRVAIAVTDDGPGIPEPLRARLFEPFFTTKGPGKGTGLGLYIARRIAKRLGGDVAVESRPGETTFTVVLPAAEARAEIG